MPTPVRNPSPFVTLMAVWALMVTSGLHSQTPEQAARAPQLAIEGLQTEPNQEIFFSTQVLPILQQHCFECHSHKSQTMEGGLALDYRSGWAEGGDSGPAVVPGKPDGSLLMDAVYRRNGLAMPPDDPLPDTAIATLEQWVQNGAFDPRTSVPQAEESEWWSLRPLMRPALPDRAIAKASLELSSAHQVPMNAIDSYVSAEHAKHGLTFSPPADRRQLIRRVKLDLLGLPPSYDEVVAFESDVCIDAYERMVDRLLASPAYGERWARHWMDTIHFAETHGFEHDVARPNAWTYRDYLIKRLNDDVAWSRFVREQLAADHFFPEQPELTPALGFLGAGTFDISSLTTAPMTFAYLDRDDMVTQTMSALASSTVNCARCHAHKFDPITQEDYFALQAVFAGVVKGDRAFDIDSRVASERQQWQQLLESVKARDEKILLADRWREVVENYAASMQSDATLWTICQPEAFEGTESAQLKQLDDSSLLASPPYPARTTYSVTMKSPLQRLTALRIEVMEHESLPKRGPGCATNGNLHLSEIEIRIVPGAEHAPSGQPQPIEPVSTESTSTAATTAASASTQSATTNANGSSMSDRVPRAGQKLKLSRAFADFDQEGWSADKAIDGVTSTAWGIHPQEGRSHAIVVQLAEAVHLPADSRVEVVLHQAHGGVHVIGRLRLSITDRDTPKIAPIADEVVDALRASAATRTADQQLALAAAALKHHATERLASIPPQQLVYAAGSKVQAGNGAAAQAVDKPQAIHLLNRGDITKPGREVGPGALSAIRSMPHRFEPLAEAGEAARRAALADWLVDHRNPLSWRSIANRVWAYHFGRGLCDTPSDFGKMGGVVTHPELLDWLACELRDGPESLKHIHRAIVTSATYRQSSQANDSALLADAENRYLWRQHRQRMDADSYRDAVMSASGALDRSMGGPSVQQFSTSPGAQLTPMVDYKKFDWRAQSAARRSIYRFVWRGIADPFMESLDFPDLGLLTPQRSQSSSALQALTLYNNEFVLVHSRLLAERVSSTVTESAAITSLSQAKVDEVFYRALQRAPTEAESQLLHPLVDEYGLALVCRIVFNSNEFLFLD